MRNPIQAAREWWINRSIPTTVPSPREVIESGGTNTTFRHQPWCRLPVRPCLCFPRYTDNAGIVREFWTTPHPNRHARRQLARQARA